MNQDMNLIKLVILDIIVELNSIQMAHLKQNTLCCKISIKISTCNVNISILASIHINKYLVLLLLLHECL